MIKSIEDYGAYIEKAVPESPEKARARLLLGYKLFGMKLKLFPNKKLPLAKQKSAVYLNHVIRSVFEEPENTALVNIFMPCEILEALNIRPICAELFSGFMNGTFCEKVFAEDAERRGISETFCSYHKVFLGAVYTKLLPPPLAIINTSFVCDANSLTFREIASQFNSAKLNVPHYYLEVPNEQSEVSVTAVAEQLREVTQVLETVTERKLDEAALKAAVKRSAETVNLLKKILHEKKTKYLASDITSEMYETYLTHNGLGTQFALDYAKIFLEDFKQAKKYEGIKILWLHTVPSQILVVKELFDFTERCQIITCDINFENLVEPDPEHPYESMAKRLVYSTWNSGRSRVEAAVTMGKELGIDGAVCFCQWGCKQTMGLSGLFKERFECEGIPVLVLDGDGCDRRNSSDGQISTRLNAFIEMLERRRSGKHS